MIVDIVGVDVGAASYGSARGYKGLDVLNIWDRVRSIRS